jgi:phosphonate transport system substrate-binding protein
MLRAVFSTFALTAGAHATTPSEPTAQSDAFRFGFSSEIIVDLNENDTKAAMKVWGRAVVAEREIPVYAEPVFLRRFDALLDSFRAGRVDALSLTAPEYFALARVAGTNSLLLASYKGQLTEEYLLLVNAEAGIASLAELRGRSLLFWRQPRTALAEAWLDTLLLQKSLGSADRFLARMQTRTKITQVVLPVFFRQADACVVHRRGFEVMCELNPQLARKLQILAASPAFVPGLLCFRTSYQPPFRDDLVRALTELDRSPEGRQMLTLFQCDQIVPASADALEPARRLIEEHARLRREAGLPATDPASAAAP